MSTTSLNSEQLNPSPTAGFPVPITADQYTLAQQHAQQHTAPAKQQRVLHHTLAVLAVEAYCRYMGISTDRAANYSFDPIHQTTNDVADVALVGLGRLECRALGEVCPLWSDCLGVVAVQWDETTQTMRLLGFVPHTQLDPDAPLTAFAPIDALFEQIAETELHQLQMCWDDAVMIRVEERLKTSHVAIVLELERLLQRDLSPREREHRLRDFLMGQEMAFSGAGGDREMLGQPKETDESINQQLHNQQLQNECLELAEDLLDRLEDWWS